MSASKPESSSHFDQEPQRAWRFASAHLCFWGVTVFFFALDLWSKHRVFATLKPAEIKPVIGGFMDFRRSLNDGAVFGSFTGQTGVFIAASVFALGFVLYLFASSNVGQRWLHVALGLVLAGALGNLYDRAAIQADVVEFRTESGRAVSMIGHVISASDEPNVRVRDWPDDGPVRTIAKSRVTAVRRQGVVRDFMKFVPKFPDWVPKVGGRDVWPWVFNVADVALVVGVMLLLLQSRTHRSPPAERTS